MKVVIASARHRAEWGGRASYLCCHHCRRAFLADPTAYLTEA
jgi:YHS domain-containing protein